MALDQNSGLPLDPATLQALQDQQRYKDTAETGGNAATRLNIGAVNQGVSNLFPSQAMQQARASQQALQGAQTTQNPGESDLDYSIRQLAAQRDAVASSDPRSAAQMNTQLLKMGQMKLEQTKLQAQDSRAQEDHDANAGERAQKQATGALAYVVTQDPKAELGYTAQAFDTSSPDGVAGLKDAAQKPGAQVMSADKAAALFNSSNSADMRLAGQLARTAASATGSLPPDAIPQIAVESIFDKSAMSRFTPGDRAAIASFKVSKGITPTDEISAQTEIKAVQAAATQAGRREGSITLLQQSLGGMGNQVLDSLKGLSRTDFAPLNSGIMAGKREFSDPGEARYAAAVQTFVNEYARVISGGSGNSTEGARKEAWATLNKAGGPASVAAAVHQMAVTESGIVQQAGDAAIEMLAYPGRYRALTKIQKAAGLAPPMLNNQDLQVTNPNPTTAPQTQTAPAAPNGTIPSGWSVVAH